MRRSIVSIRLTIVAGLLLLCAHPPMRAQGGVNPAPADKAQLAQNGNYYALVIGINDYAPPLPKLATAVADAKAIAKVLSDNYGFQVKLLIDQDATRSNILKAISQYRNKLNENDNLLIYYAGHGISDRRADKAYWIPVDADSVDSPNRIIADEITTDVRVQSARHVLIISDSCYSGGLIRGADAPAQSGGLIAFLNRMLTSRSRTLMASGGDEPVADGGPDGHSVFAEAVLRSLQQTSESVFTASDLFYGSVRQQVAGRSSQLPQYSIIRNSSHDDGDFVFMRKVGAKPAATLSTAEAGELSTKGQALLDAKRFAEALPLLQRSCDGNVALACTDLGIAYEEGLGVAKDLAHAAALYGQACDGNNMLGCSALGLLYQEGWGVRKDAVRAASLYRQACDGKNAGGCVNLGFAYENGLGVDNDLAHAASLYRQACNGNDAFGCGPLGNLYATGRGVAKDLAEAARLFRLACDGDDARSCYFLAFAYRYGHGVNTDEAQAGKLFQKSCSLGNSNACSETKPK